MKQQLTGAGALSRVLLSAGVSDAFGIASGKLSPLFRALASDARWQYTGVRHEASAAFMATAVYAATGRIALCLGETGPGGANLMSGLGGASVNNLAVLAITSSNPSYLLGPSRGAFSSTANENVFHPVTKWNATIRDVARIPELARHALRMALSGAPGPVHLDIPTEILNQQHEFDLDELDAAPSTYRGVSHSVPSSSSLAEAAYLLKRAERPLLVAGGGVVRSGAHGAFTQLSEQLGAPTMTTQMGLGGISTTHPLCIGQGGFVGGPAVVRAIMEADVILAAGCRFGSFMWAAGLPNWGASLARKLIQIDIDPGRLGQNLPLSIGLQGDARPTLEALLPYLSQLPSTSSEWLIGLTRERDAYKAQLNELADSNGAVMHPAALAREVGKVIGPADLVTFDGGHTSFWSNDFTPAIMPGTRFHEPGMAHLGFGLPWSIALGRQFPDRRSFCLTGDGAFGFTLQELDTARRYGVNNLLTVIHNNEAWGVIGFAQQKHGFQFGTELTDIDYAAVARGFGCFGMRVESLAEMPGAIQLALGSGLPSVIDARVSFEPHPMMPVFGKSTAAR